MLNKQTKNPCTQIASATFEPLEDRKLFASSLSLGINVNDVKSSNYNTIVNALKDTGTKTVRLWYGFSSYDTRSEAGIFKYVRSFSAAGFDVMLAVVPNNGINGSDSQVRGLFSWLAGSANLKGSVDRWQIGNEPDSEHYWKGTPSSYVAKLLKPAASVLHAAGEKVVSAGPSWNPMVVKEMVDAGMLSSVDFVGYHPYRNTVEDLKKRIGEVKSFVNGKPLVASEWNIRGRESNKSSWAAGVEDFWPIIRDNFYAAYYFCSTVNSSMAGPGGITYSSGAKNEPFYSVYKSFKSSFSGGGSVITQPPVVVPPPVVTPPGNTPASTTTKPTISGFTIIDGATGRALSGYSNITSSKTISLSSLPTRNIQILAIANSKTESVKLSWTGRSTRIENNAPYELFANSQGTASSWYATKGTYTLKATGYTADRATGTAGSTKTITLTFT